MLDLSTGLFSVRTGDQVKPLRARIYSDGLVGLRQLGVNDGRPSGYVPLDLLRVSAQSSGYLLPFMSLDGEQRFQLWRLNSDFTYVDQARISEAELVLLYRLNLLPIDSTRWYEALPAELVHALSHSVTRLSTAAANLECVPSDGLGYSGHSRHSKALTIAFEDTKKISFGDLTTKLEEFVVVSAGGMGFDADDVRRAWLEVCAGGLWMGNPTRFPDQFRYEYLRELVAIFAGRDVIFNPFTGDHQYCIASRFFEVPDNAGRVGKFCIALHRGLPIVDFRGIGWSACSMAYQVGNYFMFESPLSGGTAWRQDYNKLLKDHSAKLAAAMTEQADVLIKPLVLNSSDQRNLGHYFWSDLSGYHLVSKSSSLSGRVTMAACGAASGRFAGTENYHQFSVRCELFPEETRIFQSEVEQASVFAHPRPVILKALSFSADLAERLRRKASSGSGRIVELGLGRLLEGGSLNIIVNVRSHNKRWLNVVECFSRLFDQVSDFGARRKIKFVLEYGPGAENVAGELECLMRSQHFAAMSAFNINVEDLLFLLHHSHLVVAPVGSGLVLPTWVFGLPVVAHGDPAHMRQLQWWGRVSEHSCSGRSSEIFAVGESDIYPIEDKGYSDYRINADAFANLMKAILRQNDAFPVL
jgi:hypothetical protein